MSSFSRIALAAALVLSVGANVHAAETRFQYVSLLAARDRVSLVFELSGEPQNVATRRVSAAVLELDAGPVVMPARATSFMAPAGVRFVMGVSIQGGDGTSGHLKARITLLERARSAVRVVGHRVYVDFSPESLPTVQPERAASIADSTAIAPPATRAAAPVAPPPPADPSPREAYRATMQPAVERFDQLTPFLLSAAASPSEPVLKAVGSTLAGIQGLLLSVEAPIESRRTHEALSSAVSAALTAVSPTFSGDRAAQAKQALGLLEQAKSSW
ncbi:MAG TPA: hypothetical protein VFD21_16340 [Vicinamibacterales bacterium]|nr:hypothetical protein [Vicinamibacterales bacterium]